jgi:hypothetical protein
MWARIMSTVDKLISLLKSEPFDAGSSESLWDRTMIYVATDFGRTRSRPDNAMQFWQRTRSEQRIPADVPDGKRQHHPGWSRSADDADLRL